MAKLARAKDYLTDASRLVREANSALASLQVQPRSMSIETAIRNVSRMRTRGLELVASIELASKNTEEERQKVWVIADEALTLRTRLRRYTTKEDREYAV